MVLRSGCIIPFQFRDNKKLLMIGVPEENRDLSIWDLKSVVRAAFGIYNFQFRNKKIGFIIPDELLLNYLAQRHDLTNFVIEIGKVKDKSLSNENLSFEPSCSQKVNTPVSQNSNDSATNENSEVYVIVNEALKSPLEENNTNKPTKKIRVSHAYRTHSPETKTQSIDHMDLVEKSNNVVHDIDLDIKEEITSQDYDQQNLNAVIKSEMPYKSVPLSTQSQLHQQTRQQHFARQNNTYKPKDGLTNDESNSELFPADGIVTTRRFKMFSHLGDVNNKRIQHNQRSFINENDSTRRRPERSVNRKRHSRWSPEEEYVLLQLWEQKLFKLHEQKRNAHVYAQIADVMCHKKFNFNAVEIRNKIKNMTKRYRDEKKTGVPSDWQHFDQVKRLLDKCKSFNIKNMVEESVANTLSPQNDADFPRPGSPPSPTDSDSPEITTEQKTNVIQTLRDVDDSFKPKLLVKPTININDASGSQTLTLLHDQPDTSS